MNGAQYLIKRLKDYGVDTLFGYPGGCIMPVYDALLDLDMRHILCRHEQGSAFAANGYARSSGRLGVCLATSGPGATNLITAIADAYMDSVPMLAITGQVPTSLIGTDAFQEIDVLGLSLPITKHSYLVENVAQLPAILEQAIDLAQTGRPGPVLIDIPKDVQLAEFTPQSNGALQEASTVLKSLNMSLMQQAQEMIRNSQKPIIYAGGGVLLAGAVDTFREFVQISGIPTVLTLKGLGNLPADDGLNLGMLGMHGSVSANLAVQECDLIIAVGARFDDRVTGRLAEFAPQAKTIHIDIDEAETGKLRAVDCVLHGEINSILQALSTPLALSEWANHCQQRHDQHSFDANTAPAQAIDLLRTLSTVAQPDAIISCDVGQHQMWVAQYYPISHPRRHLTSGGLGAMGFGLPAAIGAQLAHSQAQVIAVSGDGSIMMNIQELATLFRYRLPIKIILLDNQVLGMVRQQQELCYQQRFSEIDLSDNPPFIELAQAFGIQAMSIDFKNDLANQLTHFLNISGPALLHVPVASNENVWPMVKPGDANDQMITCS
jgi:acetolactate synthase I/II/III large subunit